MTDKLISLMGNHFIMYTYIKASCCTPQVYTVFSCLFCLSKAGGGENFAVAGNSHPPRDWSLLQEESAALHPRPVRLAHRSSPQCLGEVDSSCPCSSPSLGASVPTAQGLYWMTSHVPPRTATSLSLNSSPATDSSYLPASPSTALLHGGHWLYLEPNFSEHRTIPHTLRGSTASLTDCLLILFGIFFLASYRAY